MFAGCSVVACSAPIDEQAYAFEIKFPGGNQAPRDVMLAAADEVTFRRCMCIIDAASKGTSSMKDIASAVAVTRDLFGMQGLSVVNARFWQHWAELQSKGWTRRL